MTYSSPSTSSFRPYPSTSRHHPTPSRPSYPVYHSADADHPVYHRRRSNEDYPAAHLSSSSAAPSSASSSSYSPLSLCSSVSSVSSSSSGSAVSSEASHYSHADSFELHEMEDDRHHYYPTPAAHHKPTAAPRHKPHPTVVHPQDPYIPYPTPSPSYHHPLPISVSIPPSSWKEPSLPRRPADYPSPPIIAATPLPDPSFVDGAMKKKKARSLRRCMDREKHSKAEQKRRGEMKALFDQLQEVSNCVYKDRIHILSLAIETIQGQRATIEELRAGKRKVKGEGEVKTASSSSSPTSSSSSSSPSTSPQLTAQRRKSTDLTVKQEDDCPSSAKKSRPSSPVEVHEVLDLSVDSKQAEPPAVYSTTLAASSSSVSLSTYGQGEFAYLMDGEEGHAAHRLPPCMSPAPSFTFQPQGEWWPTVEARKGQ